MIRETWTTTEIATAFPEVKSVADFVKKIDQSLEKKSSVLCRIRIDGSELKEEHDLVTAQSIADVGEIEIEVAPKAEVIRMTLMSLNELINQLKETSREVAQQLRADGVHAAFEDFDHLIEGIAYFIKAAKRVRSACQAESYPLRHFGLWATTESSFLSVVHGIVAAFEIQDLVLVADLLQFDLNESLEDWRDLLDVYRDESHENILEGVAL